jgi:nitrogenase molybdenum-iron protein NifN
MEGFHAAVRATVDALTQPATRTGALNLLPGFVSPADLRYLKEIVRDFGLTGIVLPDYAERLDGPALDHYEKIPAGGTPVAAIRAMSGACGTLEFGRVLFPTDGSAMGATESISAGALLADRFRVPHFPLGTPIGLRETDAFCQVLESLSGRKLPEKHAAERGRLVDAYVDGHKYIFGKRAVVYGEEDLVIGLTAFLVEIGIRPVLCASGGRSGRLEEAIATVTHSYLSEPPIVREGTDFYAIAETVRGLAPDVMIGNSKGYRLTRELQVPLIRVGFPIHDRFGSQRVLHVGYRGTQALLDRIINAVLEKDQDCSPVGYGYL